jgi:hypothetical protein
MSVEPVKVDSETSSVTPSSSNRRPLPIKKGDMFSPNNEGSGTQLVPRRNRYKPVRAFVDFSLSPTKVPSWASQIPDSNSRKQHHPSEILSLQSSACLRSSQKMHDQPKPTYGMVQGAHALTSARSYPNEDLFSTSCPTAIKYVRSGSHEQISTPVTPPLYSKCWKENDSSSFSELAPAQEISSSSSESYQPTAPCNIPVDRNSMPISAPTIHSHSLTKYTPLYRLPDVPKPVAKVEGRGRDVPHIMATTIGWEDGRVSEDKAFIEQDQAPQGFFGLLRQGLFGGWK